MNFDITKLLFDGAIDIGKKFFTNEADQKKYNSELETLKINAELKKQEWEAQQNLGQIEINKVEAGHSNIFVSGWRPFIGWACGIAIVWAFLLQPLFTWFAMMIGHDITVDSSNTDQLFQLVLAMLGMGGLRTFEKIKGVAKS